MALLLVENAICILALNGANMALSRNLGNALHIEMGLVKKGNMFPKPPNLARQARAVI
ncbi:hypothetical protein [Parasphingorhabdus sp.]|uniref:hypothetical protein n=1 Tax=Parasphingorhabdus sp. TaxID=2709688 RepID=UPI0035938A17